MIIYIIYTFINHRSSPYDYNPKKKNEKNNKDRSIPFLLCSHGEYFDINPYFTKDIIPTYIKTFTEKFKGTPFKPSSAIKRVCYIMHIMILYYKSFINLYFVYL